MHYNPLIFALYLKHNINISPTYYSKINLFKIFFHSGTSTPEVAIDIRDEKEEHDLLDGEQKEEEKEGEEAAPLLGKFASNAREQYDEDEDEKDQVESGWYFIRLVVLTSRHTSRLLGRHPY